MYSALNMSVSSIKTILFVIIIATAAYASYPEYTRSNIIVHNHHRKSNHVFQDMPTKNDLDGYLKALRRIIDFAAANKNDIDINFAFGLFLVNVNLKSVIKHRHMNVPLLMLQPIRQLVKKNTELLDFFHDMVKKDKTEGNKQSKAIYLLFLNDTVWVERLDRYDAVFKTNKNQMSFEQLQAKYKTWEQYTRRIFDFDGKAVPGPKLSDHCVSAEALGPMEVKHFKRRCVLPTECYTMLENGSDYGYALTHRLIIMILARYGRGCSIFSPSRDRELTAKYCTAAYAEAQYIAMQQYKSGIDLLMEQITFCVLEGHIEFLKRTWLRNVIKHQVSDGCFGLYPDRNSNHPKRVTRARQWKLAKDTYNQGIEGGPCNGHFTSTAAAAIAGAVRFILTTTKFIT